MKEAEMRRRNTYWQNEKNNQRGNANRFQPKNKTNGTQKTSSDSHQTKEVAMIDVSHENNTCTEQPAESDTYGPEPEQKEDYRVEVTDVNAIETGSDIHEESSRGGRARWGRRRQ
jgi:hypothetical protein